MFVECRYLEDHPRTSELIGVPKNFLVLWDMPVGLDGRRLLRIIEDFPLSSAVNSLIGYGVLAQEVHAHISFPIA